MQNMKIYNINYLINGLINYLINYLIEKRVGRKHLSAHARARGAHCMCANAWNQLFFRLNN